MTENTQLAVVEANDAKLELQQPSATSASGYQITLVPVPTSLDFTPLQAAVVLKSQPGFQDANLGYLLYTLAFCAHAGLDPLRDIYRIGGRIGVYDEVKIRNMRQQATLEWVRVSDPERAKNPISGMDDVYVIAEAKDKRWSEPERYTAWLSEWANGKSIVWTQAPIDALQRKALARLAHRMYPMFGEQDSAPPSAPTTADKLADSFKAAVVTNNPSNASNTNGGTETQ